MTIIAPADPVPIPCPMFVSREGPLPKLATNSSGVPSLCRAFPRHLESHVGECCIPKRKKIRMPRLGRGGAGEIRSWFPEAVADGRFWGGLKESWARSPNPSSQGAVV